MEFESKIRFTAYHGTTSKNLPSIMDTGFKESKENDEWLGQGSYFFVDGLNNPKTSAIKWAICSCWDKLMNRYEENSISVVKTTLTTPSHLVFDLREKESSKKFHEYRSKWLDRDKDLRLKNYERPLHVTYDTQIINDFKNEWKIKIVVSNFHIQLTTYERYLRLDSRIPNVSVLCLSDVLNKDIELTISEIETFEPMEWMPLVDYEKA